MPSPSFGVYKSLDKKIAVLFLKTGLKEIPLEKLHSAFYNLKQKYDDFFSDLHFISKGSSPVSEDLQQAFPALCFKGAYMSCPNPEYIIYTLNLQQKNRIKKYILPTFNEDEKEITEIAEELKRLLK
jgi:hypothetical protein